MQEQVDKTMIFDYTRAVEPTVECWLGLIRSKLLAHEYDYPDQMVRDVDKIRKCAEQYHGKRQSKFRNPGQPSGVDLAYTCHAVHSYDFARHFVSLKHATENVSQEVSMWFEVSILLPVLLCSYYMLAASSVFTCAMLSPAAVINHVY